MQFRLVLLGALLLTAGLIAYSAIPNVQRSPILTEQYIIEEDLSLPANRSYVIAENIAIANGERSEMILNLTVMAPQGELAEIGLMVFLRNETLSCFTTRPQTYLLNQKVSNVTLTVPVESSGSYCFILDNESHFTDKTASIYVVLEKRSEQVLVSRNGSANVAGLGVGAFGFLVFVYGVARKTVIPWE
jgi:hypothetical protein